MSPFRMGPIWWLRVKRSNRELKRVSTSTTDRPTADAMEAMVTLLKQQRRWGVLDAVADKRVTLAEVYDHYRIDPSLNGLEDRLSDVDLNDYVDGWQRWAMRRASGGTVEKYLLQLRGLLPEGARVPRSAMTRRALSSALSGLDVSGSTARRYHAAWSSFFNYLVEQEVYDYNPMRAVKAPAENGARERWLTLENVLRLVDAQPFPYSALAALREGAGVEISAALQVRRLDCNPDTHFVHVRGTKNAWRERDVLVDPWAWEKFARALGDKLPGALLFEGITLRKAYYQHKLATRALEIPDYTLHDARHSYAVRHMQLGTRPELIANNLGHADASQVLRRYGKYRPRPEHYTQSHLK